MNEATWLACDDPATMLDYARGPRRPGDWSISDRKLRLFADACRDLGFCAMRLENAAEDAHHMARCVKDDPNRHHVPAVAVLLRDIIGNPFRPITLPPAEYLHHDGDQVRSTPILSRHRYAIPIVLSIARRIYDERDFAGMPILADALEDAGCDNEEILKHCRIMSRLEREHWEGKIWYGTGMRNVIHVRGCWVLDCLLGKE